MNEALTNWQIARGIARKWHELHVAAKNSTPRFFSDNLIEDQIGIFGQLEFGKKYNMYVDLEGRVRGDRTDFPTVLGLLDVKTARSPKNLLIKERDIGKSDLYVLGGFVMGPPRVYFLGWEYDFVMKEMPRRAFGYEIISYYRPRQELRPMEEFEKLIGWRIVNE